MKFLLENWREYLKEADNLEQNVYSFDFDNTLIRYHTPRRRGCRISRASRRKYPIS